MKRKLLFSLGVLLISSLISTAQTISIYSEDTEIEASPSLVTVGMYQLTAEEVFDAENVYEGAAATHIFNTDFTTGKIYWSVPTGEETDLTSYIETGYLNFAIKTATAIPFTIEFKQGTLKAPLIFDETTDANYGIIRDDAWHFVSIPLIDFALSASFPADWNWALVKELFTLRMHQDPAGEEFSMFVDNIYISMEMPEVVVPTGIFNNLANQLSIYPNPVQNKISIQSDVEMIGDIYSVTGQKVKSFSQVGKSLDVSELENGVYILSIKSGKKQYHQRFIKAN